MPPKRVNLAEKLGQFSEQWSPKNVAAFEDFHFRVAKVEGDFVWHAHEDSDEMFFVIDGRLRIDFRDGSVELDPGEMLVVPRGVEHKPYADEECQLMVCVREGTLNTGNATPSERTTDPSASL